MFYLRSGPINCTIGKHLQIKLQLSGSLKSIRIKGAQLAAVTGILCGPQATDIVSLAMSALTGYLQCNQIVWFVSNCYTVALEDGPIRGGPTQYGPSIKKVGHT